MKALLFAMLSLCSVSASAAALSCTGEAWVRSVYNPIPMKRTAHVVISQSEPAKGNIVATIGENPVIYTGRLYLNGENEHVVTYVSSNDQARIVIKLLNEGQKAAFRMKFVSSDNRTTASINSLLTCSSIR